MSKNNFLLLFLFLIIFSGSSAPAGKDRAYILFSNNCDGELINCGCPSHPDGAFNRRYNYITKFRLSHPDALLLDAGDNYSPVKDEIKDKYINKALELCRYSAFTIGDYDLHNGPGYFLKYKASLPFLSCNLYYKENNKIKYLVQPYKTFHIGKYSILVIGVMGKEPFRSVNDKNILFKDPVESINLILKTNKADYVVLLSHSGLKEDKIMAKKLGSIDLIIGGHSLDLIKKPVRINTTMIVQAGDNCQNMGFIELDMKNKKIAGYDMISLDETYKLPENNPIDALSAGIEQEYDEASKGLTK